MPDPLLGRVRTSVSRALLLALAVPLLLLSAPVPAAADGNSPAAHLAGLMAEQPDGREVVVSDLLAGEYDTAALEEELRAEFDRLDTPYHVVVTPYLAGRLDSEQLLASLQDRVGEEGLYVHMNDGHTVVAGSTTPGADLPTGDAGTVLMADDRYDFSSPLSEVAAGYVDALLAPDLAQRADRARASFTADAEGEPPSAWEELLEDLRPETANGAENTGFLAGGVGGVLLGFGATAWIVRLRVLAATPRTAGGARRGTRGVHGRASLVLAARRAALRRAGRLAAGCAVAAAVLCGAGLVHVLLPPQTPGEYRDERDALAAPPYVAATVRVDRVVAAWEDDPVHLDPLAPVNRGDLAEVSEAAAAIPVPVRVAAVLMGGSDESGGDPEVLAHALAHTAGEDGVYLVADLSGGDVGIATRGVETGADPWDLTDAARGSGPDATGPSATLDVLELLGGARPDPAAPDTVPEEAAYRADEGPPASRLARFLGGGLLPGLLLLGPFTGALLYGVSALCGWLLGRARAVPGRRLHPTVRRAAARMVSAADGAPPDHPHIAAAVRDTDTVLLVLGADPDELDLVGATVLARRVVRRLGTEPVQPSVCMVNPLHGTAPGQDNTALAEGGPLPMCTPCLAAPDGARHPLRVAAGRRPRVSHLSLDRTWVRTRYGTKGRLDGDRLVEETHAP